MSALEVVAYASLGVVAALMVRPTLRVVMALTDLRIVRDRSFEAVGGPKCGSRFAGPGTPPPGERIVINSYPCEVVNGVSEIAGPPLFLGAYVAQHRGPWWRRRVVFAWQPAARQEAAHADD